MPDKMALYNSNSITSAYFVMFQNGLNSIASFSSALPPGLKCTGMSRRSTRNSS
jgi:hypothetical protein